MHWHCHLSSKLHLFAPVIVVALFTKSTTKHGYRSLVTNSDLNKLSLSCELKKIIFLLALSAAFAVTIMRHYG